MVDEAQDSFALLLETGRRLLDELDGILKSSSVRQRDELLKNQPAHESRHRPTKAVKSSSLPSNEARSNASIHSAKGQDIQTRGLESGEREEELPVRDGPVIIEPSQSQQPSMIKEQLPHLTDTDALRLSQRKRKTMSACSLGDSHAARYRTKSMVVVYYDGEIQQRFESVVRTIGVCRNSMRKGKMSARINALSHDDDSIGEETLDADVITPIKLKIYPSRLGANRAVSSQDGTEAFDKADSFLDEAQALCERAAHQVLRDGDCATEVQTAKENIMSAIEVGETELPVLRSKAEQAARRREKEEADLQQRKADEESNVACDAKHQADDRRTSPPNILEVDELEVDSSAEDSDPSLSILGMLRLGKSPLSTTTRAQSGLRTTGSDF